MSLIFGVEYTPNPDEGEQFEELTELQFLELQREHQNKGLDAIITYERATTRENGASYQRLTIHDAFGLYYS